MGKNEIYQYLKSKTFEKRDQAGNQVMIKGQQIIKDNPENEATIYRILKELKKESDVHTIIAKTERTIPGKTISFKERWWWIKNGNKYR